MTNKEEMYVYLETSTVFPLLYITPYTENIIETIQYLEENYDCKYFVQKDCLREILNQFDETNIYDNVNEMKKRFQDDLIYRLKNISEQTKKGIKIEKSDLFASLLGGYIAFGENLQAKAYAFKNHHRLKAFYYSQSINSSEVISQLLKNIEKEDNNIINYLKNGINNNQIQLNTHEINSGWGNFYKTNENIVKNLDVIDDVTTKSVKKVEKIELRKWAKGRRDLYHYEVARKYYKEAKNKDRDGDRVTHGVMLVADSGFISNVGRKKIASLRIMQMQQIDFARRSKVNDKLYTNYDLATKHTIDGVIIGYKERKKIEVKNEDEKIKIVNWYYSWNTLNTKQLVPIGWRIPSKVDLEELCIFINSDEESLKKIKVDGLNGLNLIDKPMAMGFYHDGKLMCNEYCHYWSSDTCDDDTDYVWGIKVNTQKKKAYMYKYLKTCLLPVRLVRAI